MRTVRSILKLSALLGVMFGFLGCQMQSKPGMSGFSGNFSQPQNTGAGSGGSGPAGAITQFDQSAINDTTNEMQSVLPAGEDLNLPSDLVSEIKNILDQEKAARAANRQPDPRLMALKASVLQKIFQDCTKKLRKYVPIPGQPLLGDWGPIGAQTCGLSPFTISGPGSQQIYPLGGGLRGNVGAHPDGRFQLSGQNQEGSQGFSGNGQDSGYQGNPLSGTASLVTQTRSADAKGNAFVRGCTVQVNLVTSKNPIPRNYQAAIKMMGACYRRAFTIMNMDSVFQNMNSDWSSALMQQMLMMNLR